VNVWRAAFAILLAAFAVVPMLAPFGELRAADAWSWSRHDAERLIHLSCNTVLLVAGTIAVALPLGIALAILLFRTSFHFRSCGVFVLMIALFLPIPVVVSSWQATLGAQGVLPLLADAEGRPWASGMPAAIWIHGLAATPWVAITVGIGLTWVEPELEDEAAQVVGPWCVLLMVTLPRARANILGAALFVVMQTAAETSVTEMMLVPTLAEEMRTQFATSDSGLGRTLVLALPSLLLAWGLALVVVAYLESALPPLMMSAREHGNCEISPKTGRSLVAFLMIGLLLAPMGSLVWKLGLTGYPSTWHLDVARSFLTTETRLLGGELVASLLTTAITGTAVAIAALIGCWLARERPWLRWLLISVVLWLWVLPGPAVGMALKQVIAFLPEGPWKSLLYFGPSPAPLMWAQGLRALPVAVVFLWPILRMIPRELLEEARLGGAGPLSELLHVVLPMTWRALFVTATASTALCLCEVGASARVETPGWQSFAKTLLDHMHTGVDNNVAALCLMMLGAIVVCVTVVWISQWLLCRR
jgi:iron(III) transport system permease protein